MGSYEFLRGFANAGILQAAVIETVLAVTYFLFWLAGRRSAVQSQPVAVP
jgi:cbb3-type cytochrome oxidase subunit 3